jgi:hypothetical protein
MFAWISSSSHDPDASSGKDITVQDGEAAANDENFNRNYVPGQDEVIGNAAEPYRSHAETNDEYHLYTSSLDGSYPLNAGIDEAPPPAKLFQHYRSPADEKLTSPSIPSSSQYRSFSAVTPYATPAQYSDEFNAAYSSDATIQHVSSPPLQRQPSPADDSADYYGLHSSSNNYQHTSPQQNVSFHRSQGPANMTSILATEAEPEFSASGHPPYATGPPNPSQQQIVALPRGLDQQPSAAETAAKVLRVMPLVFCQDNHAEMQEGINLLEEEAQEQKKQYANRMYEMECRLSALTAQFATEVLDRDQNLQQWHEAHQKARNDFVEQVTLERDSSRTAGSRGRAGWVELERRITILDARMTQSVYVELQDRKREYLSSVQSSLQQNVKQVLHMDVSDADQHENNLVRQLEQLAGTMSRRYHEERATRIAELEVLTQRIKQIFVDDTTSSMGDGSDDDEDDDDATSQQQPSVSESSVRKKSDEIMIAIRDLRQQIARERVERDEQDRRVVELIQASTLRMRRAILQACTAEEEEENDIVIPQIAAQEHHEEY